jgi:formiminotetrahydrofolate cyclodeaminase
LTGSAERPLSDLLAALAARAPAPGGGSASAWSGAVAAAVLEMAAAFAGDSTVVQRAAVLQAELLTLGERELHSYAPVLEAVRLPLNDPLRAERLAAALSEASETPLAIARATVEVAELAEAIAQASRPAVKGDATAAVLLAEGACQAAARLVAINLAGAGGDPRLAEVARLAGRAAEARSRALESAL